MTKGEAYSQPGWAVRAPPCRAAGILYSKGSDTWSETEGGAGKKMEIFDRFSEIPAQTTWTASRHVCLAVKRAAYSANENYLQSSRISAFMCSDHLDDGWQLQGFHATVVWQGLLRERQAQGCASRWTIYARLSLPNEGLWHRQRHSHSPDCNSVAKVEAESGRGLPVEEVLALRRAFSSPTAPLGRF